MQSAFGIEHGYELISKETVYNITSLGKPEKPYHYERTETIPHRSSAHQRAHNWARYAREADEAPKPHRTSGRAALLQTAGIAAGGTGAYLLANRGKRKRK